MDIKTKIELIDLIVHTPCVSVSSKIAAEHIIEHLAENGIMFQKWHPVSTTPKDGLYIVKLSNKNKLPARYNCGKWIACEGYKDITEQVVRWTEIA